MAISSDRAPRRGREGSAARTLPLALLLALLAGAGEARVLLTLEEALALAFPGCEIERRTVFLTEAQLERARELAGVEVASALVHPYVASCPQGEGGTAYFDTHLVRTQEESLMVTVDADDAVRRIEVVTFREPPEYIPRDIWYEQFLERRLDEGLRLKREIRGVTGATLTARATTDAVRRVLAIHRAIAESRAGGKR